MPKGLFSLFLCLMLTVLPASPVHSNSDPTLRFGISVIAPPWEAGNFIRDTARYLQWKLPQYQIEINFLEPEEIRSALKNKELDFIICSPLLLGSLNEPSVRVLSTIISREEQDPDKATGGAVLVRKDSGINSLKQLKGKTIVTTAKDDFSSFIPIQSEIASMGEDPEKFFSAVHFEGMTEARRVLNKLIRKQADAAIVRAGYLDEKLKASGENLKDVLKVVPIEEGQGSDSLKVTGRQFPNEVIAATATVPNSAVRDVLAILLSKPTNGWGQHWSVTPDLTEVESLLKNLKLGPFEYLRHWNFKRVWDEYRLVFISGLLILLFLALHSTLAEMKVKRRTKQLVRAMEKQRQAQVKLTALNKKIEGLERSGIVGQLSTIVAHEMKHQLAGIIHMNYAIRRRIEDGLSVENPDPEFLMEVEEGLEDIDRQAKKATEIIEHVRSFGRRKNASVEVIDLKSVVVETVEDFKQVRHWNNPLEVSVESDCLLEGKRIEMEILLLNLLKNATDAALFSDKPKVKVSLRHQNEYLILRVENNGQKLSEKTLESMRKFSAETSKADGLGLGLGIIQTISEQLLGTVRIEAIPSGGAVFEIKFPRYSDAVRSSIRTPDEEKNP